MRIFTHLQLIAVMVLFTFFFTGCRKVPSASFTADKTTLIEGESVQFSDLSTNDPTIWAWTFNGGTPAFSQTPNPTITYNTEGVYPVTLEIRSKGGSDLITMDNYITVLPATTDLTFNNNTYTEVFIDINGVVKSVASGESVTYFDLEGNNISYYAITSGKTSDDNLVGVTLEWDFTIDLIAGEMDYALDIGTVFFFLYITNNGTHVLSPLVVYHGDTEPLIENIAIPTDGIKYNIGYYRAWEFTEIRGYWEDQPDWYTIWKNNEHFTFPDEINQNVSLSNTYKKRARFDAGTVPVEREVQRVLPAYNEVPGNPVKEGIIHHFPKEK